MKIDNLLDKALNNNFLSKEEGLFLYETATTPELMYVANELRKKEIPGNKVTWLIDRNVNITNVCKVGCKFCNFHRKPKQEDSYITSTDEYKQKIEELKKLGGNQFLLQGGIHPKLGIKFYSDLFRELKAIYPELKLHALGPPEIVHISKMEKMSYEDVLNQLTEAGLDSLPGAGAEILIDRVRNIVSPAKCNSNEWLNVMRVAHKLKLTTSATMMFGHIETKAERIEHLIKIREVQSEKPSDSIGFIAFIPWPFQDENTKLWLKENVSNSVTADEYIRTIAISRILLRNVQNIQASWLTVGKEVGQICLHAGANDFGSIMIEENVVSSAGASHEFDAKGMQQAISEAGFVPQLRNQNYESLI
ncbi:MAG: dehypoxanthine futalosine cyclase [Bacteroidetes bacterium]|jgi:cyclic dehypoxanthinyl futalosine synthase|nr:dehypoxanthine futalosine cyclase [Bacteroidota bacterium]MBT6686533.1 dehypoxanthine futalosine cyclase [Bacteroidota bacterium]MBT7144826.1 dehypoxanthine futalosine cyclase [Bacteroidota bacterium]MBT7491309.1 dehypoxanthine futalosine cyclase [Bacteroidota bacterium]